MSHNYFTSLSISPNRKWLIIPILILFLYEHLISFTQSLRFICNYASLRNAELVYKEEALYLRFFTQELKMRKFAISCCAFSAGKSGTKNFPLRKPAFYCSLASSLATADKQHNTSYLLPPFPQPPFFSIMTRGLLIICYTSTSMLQMPTSAAMKTSFA